MLLIRASTSLCRVVSSSSSWISSSISCLFGLDMEIALMRLKRRFVGFRVFFGDNVVRCKDAVSFVAIVVDVKRNFTLLS